MKFACSLDINQKIDTIVEIFLDPRNLKHTQEGFISKELISGNSGKVGSKYKIVYEKLELIETILINNLPEEFKGLYEHKHMVNIMKVNFESLNVDNTRYISEIEYPKFKVY